MAVEAIFVDTNVLVYANWTGAARHADARSKLQSLKSGWRLCVSRQVLREFLVAVTRPQGAVTPMAVDEAVATVDAFASIFDVVEDGPSIGAALLDLVAHKASHIFNTLQARGVISVAERQAYIGRVRELAKGACQAWMDKNGWAA